MKEKIDNYFNARLSLREAVGSIIGYSDPEDEFVDVRDKHWAIDGESLIIDQDMNCMSSRLNLVEDGGRYYEISSLGNRGQKKYMGVDGDIHFIMAYEDGESWDTSEIFILSEEKKL